MRSGIPPKMFNDINNTSVPITLVVNKEIKLQGTKENSLNHIFYSELLSDSVHIKKTKDGEQFIYQTSDHEIKQKVYNKME